MINKPQVTIIGGGLAGSEAAWQAAERGASVRLFEMRPARLTPAHQSAKSRAPRLTFSKKSCDAEDHFSSRLLTKRRFQRAQRWPSIVSASLKKLVAASLRIPTSRSLGKKRKRFLMTDQS